MADPLSPDLQATVQTLAAAGRDQLERHLSGRSAGWRMALLRGMGAVAVGMFAAGLAVFLTVVVLNLVFHYMPS